MSSNVGAIKGKKDLIDVINDNIIPLTAIALIHRIGLKKIQDVFVVQRPLSNRWFCQT